MPKNQYVRRQTSRYANVPKSYLWDVTYNGRTVQKWAVTANGARSQAMSDFGVRDIVGIHASRVKEQGNADE